MNKNKIVKIILLFLIFVCLIIIIYSIINIINWDESNKENNKIKEKINEYVEKDEESDEYKIDWTKIKEENADTIAYIEIKNTNIKYFIVKGNDNDYYLNHNFDKKYSKAGWIFMNYINKLDGSDKNISIFGHNRLDGSMFGTLNKTLNKDWQDDASNHEIVFITENEKSIYRVFSTYKIKAEDYYIKTEFNSNEFNDFVNKLKSRSNYNYNNDVNEESKIITLSTCDVDNNYRIVLHAKKIEM